jgi:predicted Zn-dependent protease
VSEALELAERACRLCRGDATEAVVQRERSGLARFAASQVHQPTLIANETVSLRVVRGERQGSAATNRIDDEGLLAAARRTEEAADAARPDPDFPGLAPPAVPPDVTGRDPETAELGPAAQAERAWEAIEAAGGIGLYGYFTSGESELAVASTTGLAVAQRMTDAAILALAAGGDVSGYAAACSWRAADLDPAAVAREAAEKALRTRGAEEVAPGRYRAVLEPYAFAELLAWFGFSSLGAQALLEERSYLAGRLGERLFHPAFTLRDDGGDPRGLPKAFDFEGVPKKPVTIVEGGVARDVVWDRRTAARAGAGRRSTGHAPAPSLALMGPLPESLVVEPGDASVEQLVELVGDGVYVTRLHYLSIVDEREGIITGMTRDGTFRIRNGRVAEPLVNLRFTTAFPELARDLLGLGNEPVRVSTYDYYDERRPTATVVPAIATASFTVSGSGSGPGL